MVDSYLKYLKDVLGIKEFLNPGSAPIEAVQSSLLYFLLPSEMTIEEQDLLVKMIQAMKIGEDRYRLRVAQELTEEILLELSIASYIVNFSQALSQHLNEKLPQVPSLTTYGPDVLIKKPELKKQTWNDLQRVMKSIG